MRTCLLLSVTLAVYGAIAFGAQDLLPNPSFEEGANSPTGWRLAGAGSAQPGGVDGQRCIRVVGTGEDDSRWTADAPLTPGGVYRVAFRTRAQEGANAGCVVSGPDYANRDFAPSPEWQRCAFVFRVPDGQGVTTVHLGQWHVNGWVEFDDVSVLPVLPADRSSGGLVLGAGESTAGNHYIAVHELGGPGSTHCRFLEKQAASFNSNRWVFSAGSEVIYAHSIPGNRISRTTVDVSVGYYDGGRLCVEASRDGETWVSVGTLEKLGSVTAEVPADLLPAERLLIRLRADDALPAQGHPAPGSFQVYGYRFEADLADRTQDLRGATRYWTVQEGDPAAFAGVQLRTGDDGLGDMVALDLTADERLTGSVTARLSAGGHEATGTVARGGRAALECSLPAAGDHLVSLELAQAQPEARLVAEAEVHVADLHDASYGYLLSDDAPLAVWWCESPHKVSRTRSLPSERSSAVEIALARNEYEAAQVVLRGTQPNMRATVSMGDLRSDAGAVIPASDVEVCEVAYLWVENPSDETCGRGWWPDPLPPLNGPLALPADENQPLWITVHTRPDTRAGLYEGTLIVRAGDATREVPLRVTVYDFALPEETHVQSGFGLSPGLIWDYQNVTSAEDRQRVWDLYMQNYAAHRISIYDPMALAPYSFEVVGKPWMGGSVDDTIEGIPEGIRCVRIEDAADNTVTAVQYEPSVPVDPGQVYTFSFMVRTGKPGQQFTTTLNTYDATGTWLSGRNIDFVDTGTGQWQLIEHHVEGRLAPEARFVRPTIRPTVWTEQGENLGTAWFDDVRLLTADGANLLEDSGSENDAANVQVKLDFTAFDEAAHHYLDELKLTAFALTVHGMGGGTFFSRYLGSLGGYEQGTPEYERLFSEYLHAVQEHLREKGWLDKAYIYWFDEPDSKDYQFVRDGMELLHRAAPDIRRMLTEQIEPELIGAVDLWCPLTPSLDAAKFAERQAAGEDIWWYVCTGPKAPYCGLFIDHNAIEMRMWLWQTWKYGVNGVLVWQTNYWTSDAAYPTPGRQDPWEDPMGWVSGYSTPAGTKLQWGNGDGRFVYPANRDASDRRTPYISGPVNSIRWEMLRDGVEDYEYFHALRDAIEKAKARGGDAARIEAASKLLEVPLEITSGMTKFTRDPKLLIAHRDRLARAIEELMR